MDDIYSESDDNFDASLNSSKILKQRLSVNNGKFLNVEENDDETEKRHKRKSMGIDQFGVSSPVIKGRISISPKVTMTNEQITVHYGTCIQLASENKINQKNAFKLHLIDYLKDHLSGLQNFQVATTSLDAGSKIYASRVDNVHQNTYQVLTGLGNEKKVSNEEINEDVPTEIEDDPDKPKKQKRRININKNLFVSDMKKIRLAKTAFRVELDPLFQSQAEKFDDCGVGQLRLNNLKFIERIGELLLDSDTVVFSEYDDEDITSEESGLTNITEFYDEVMELTSQPLQISSHFEDFVFVGWQPGSATMNSTTAESVKLMKEESKLAEQMALDVQNCEDQFGTADNLDDDYYEPMDYEPGENIINELNVKCKEENIDPNQKTINEDDDLLNSTLTLGTNKGEGSHFLKSISSFVQTAQENQQDNYLAMWAGPEHFKNKIKRFISEKDALEKQKTKREMPKRDKEKKSFFPEELEVFSNSAGIIRLRFDENRLNIKQVSESSIQLTEDCLNKNIKKEYMLPPTVSKKHVGSINEMMRRKISLMMNKQIFSQDETLNNQLNGQIPATNTDFCGPPEKVNVIELSDEDGIIMEGGNICGENMDGESKGVVIDANGNVMRAEEVNKLRDADDDDYDDGGFPEECDAYMGNSFTNFEKDLNQADDEIGNTPDNQFPTVKQVEKIDINYAKTAKRINVKRLKREISNQLVSSIELKEIDELLKEANDEGKIPIYNKSTNLSDVLKTVDKQVTNEMSKDLSVPIVLTCLLFLSNEKGLNLECTSEEEGFNDIKVGQGYSEYDLEQIKEYGIQKVPNPHKRRSSSNKHSTGESPKVKSARTKEQKVFEDSSTDDDDNDEMSVS